MADSSFPASVPPEPSDGDSEDGDYNPQRPTRRLTRVSGGSTRRSSRMRGRRRSRTVTPIPRSPDVNEARESEEGDRQPVVHVESEDEGKEEGDEDRKGGKASVVRDNTGMDDLGVCRCPICTGYWSSMGAHRVWSKIEEKRTTLAFGWVAPVWQCAWDLNYSNYVYAGLQNGLILIFYLRQTIHPVRTVGGLSSHPVHTVQSIGSQGFLSGGSEDKMFLSASAVGLWNPGNLDNCMSGVVPGLEDQGVCISLAYCSLSNNIVASFRPKISATDGLSLQSSAAPLTSMSEPVKLGRYFLIRKNNAGVYAADGCFTGIVSGLRLPKSSVIGLASNKSLFTYGDETRCCLGVWDLQGLNFVSFLRPHQQPILDVKFVRSTTVGLLGCISDSMFQLYTCC